MQQTLLLVFAALLLSAGCQQGSNTGHFAVLQGDRDGHPLFAVIDTSLSDEKLRTGFPWYLAISTGLTDPTPDGLPKDSEASALNAWEDNLEKEIRAECRFVYVGRVTWKGTRTVLYYVDKAEGIVEKLKKISNNHPSRKFSVESVRDDRWDRVRTYFVNTQ